jgi:hypothetical protein
MMMVQPQKEEEEELTVAEVEVEDEGPKAPPPQQGVEAARAKPRRIENRCFFFGGGGR